MTLFQKDDPIIVMATQLVDAIELGFGWSRNHLNYDVGLIVQVEDVMKP